MFKAVLPELTDDTQENIKNLHSYLAQITIELEQSIKQTNKTDSNIRNKKIISKARPK